TMSGKLLKELSQLGSLQKNSKNLYQSAEKVLLLAFDHPKPLFVGTDRKEIEPLVERAIPLLRESFIRLNIRLEPELLEIAQRCRSGLQYIVDEFGPSGESKHIEFYDRLRSFLDGPVLSVEDYIKNCKELQIEPEELPSSWDDPSVVKWKESARDIIKTYYLSFRGSQWDQYEIDTVDEKYLLAKICFAMFGPPTEKNANNLWEGYQEEQRDRGNEILKIILKVHNENRCKKSLLVGFIVVACKQEESEYVLPIFSVFIDDDPKVASAKRVYIDTQQRVYSGWDDWKSNNNMPMLKYAYPRRGFFTCSSHCRYEFDPEKDPDIEFGTSPACDLSARIFRQTDTVTGITAFACGVIGVASMFTPIGPAVLLTSAICGGSSATYGTTRAVIRLYDKGTHGESLTDIESFTLWFSIAATPLHFTSSIVNAALIRGATENGRIFSSSMRMFATVINFSALGVDGVMIGFGIANLVEKYKQDQLSPLDVLQFSMSVFFFTNTLIKPQMASSIIAKAQSEHIQAYANNLSDADAKATFNKFLDENKGSGSIKDTSKIIRTINKIDDPNTLFSGLKDAKEIKIGGRKGKTLLVNDQNQNVNRIKPNDVTFSSQLRDNPVNFQRNIRKLFKDMNADDIDVNGKKIFQNLSDRQKSQVNKVIGGTAGKNEHILNEAINISRQMECDNVDDVLSVVELLCAEIKQKHPNIQTKDISASELQTFDKTKFIKGIKHDCEVAMKICQNKDLKFEDPLKAAYHYRKHGSDFPAVLKNQKIEVYLTKVPSNIIQDGNLANIETVTNRDGSTFITKTYITHDDKFAIVIENMDSRIISSMYRKSGSYQQHESQLPTSRQWSFDPIGSLRKQVAQSLGFRAYIPIYVNLDTPDQRFEWTENLAEELFNIVNSAIYQIRIELDYIFIFSSN
ncbi:hypothetical protein BLOT_005831, partial [Blomia tropicalis]